MARRVLCIAGLVLLAGCGSLGAVTAPQMPGTGAIATSGPAIPSDWLEAPVRPSLPQAGDPVLADILNRAGATPDIAIAAARLEQAQAQLRSARAGLLPSVSASLSGDAREAENAPESTYSSNAGLNVAIPLDLFGASRARSQAASARAGAAQFEADRVALVSRRTAGQLYAAYRTAREQSAILRRSLATADDSLTLARTRQQAGLETGLAVAQATSNRDAIAARLPGAEQAATTARLGLEALLGLQPGALVATLQRDAPVPWPDLAAAVPSPETWVRQRPDVRAQAARLAAAGLDARAAQRDRLPSGSINVLASSVSGDAMLTGQAVSTVATIATTLFDFGRLRAVAEAAGAGARAEAAAYEKVVVEGLAEVESQASRVRRADAAVVGQNATVTSSVDAVQLARVRYTSGLTSFLDVLVAERALLEAESARAAARGERADAAFAYAAALGL